MDRVVWGVLGSLIIAVSVAVFIVRLNGENNSKVLQEQRESIAEYRVELELIHDLLSKMQQEMNETKWNFEVQKPITFELLGKMQQDIQTQRKEIANDREKVSKWQAEFQTSSKTIENETSHILKDALRVIPANRKLLEQSIELLQQDMKKCQEAIADNRAKQELNSKLIEDMSQVLIELKSELSTQRDEASNNRNENLKQMQQVKSDHEQMRSIMNMHPGPYRSCKDVHRKSSGKYYIRGKDVFDSFVAYCEQDKAGGGWMVIQHRFDGSLSFDRNWTDYRNGFGEVEGEHWLGLERIHQFTKEHDCELLIEMKDFYDNYKYAKYSSFAIGSESEQYNLTTVGEYRGTAGDSLKYHKGMKFSTPDRDNDIAESNCAVKFQGGWWFYKCYHAFLNGLYQNDSGRNEKIIAWNAFSHDYRGLSYSRMMIRPLN
ncbi:fibrinogen-like protein A [Anopheles darlingi]|uniref:fibrinogen-like protein A n=1 Tax=Anopheles darlingi TaxID=43151 RepID=UPI0021005C32|nr:fibrinogen-like protein A [Anopheles darlingi]